MEAMHIPHAGVEGFEADDLVASYSHSASADGQSVCVATSDKDLMQVVGGDVRMYNTRTGKWIDHQQVVDMFGVPSHQVGPLSLFFSPSPDLILTITITFFPIPSHPQSNI